MLQNPYASNLLICSVLIPIKGLPDGAYRDLLWMVLLLALLAVILYQRNRYKLEKKRIIDQMRNTVALDLHDEMGSYISIISLYTNLAKDRTIHKDEEATQALDRVLAASLQLYDTMKDLIWIWKPNKDKGIDLGIKLQDFGETLFEDTVVDFQVVGLESIEGINFSVDFKRHIFLLFKEAIHNAFRHMKGTSVVLSFEVVDKLLEIKLQNEGELQTLEKENKGEGLRNMQKRAKALEAKLFSGIKDDAFEVVLKLPLPKE
jgi:signal transduction histidine kinase